ncbi:hypothetical protein ACFLUG_03655 [Chloroflexota bacterium]
MKMLQDVLKESGISYSTLVKYTGLGLLPQGERIWRGRKGSESVYSDSVIDTIKSVKDDKKSGLTLRQIAENKRVERSMDAFAEVMNKYPGYRFTVGRTIDTGQKRDGSISIIVQITGVPRK